MGPFHRFLFPVLWISLTVTWWVLARGLKQTIRRESVPSRLAHILPLGIALLLLWGSRASFGILGLRFLPRAAWPFWAGAALTLAGLLLMVWARLHLGRNWSGTVTVKEGHELVTSGPYPTRMRLYWSFLWMMMRACVLPFRPCW